MTASTDRIEREVLLTAHALAGLARAHRPEEFGDWFGCHCRARAMVAGKPLRGKVTHPVTSNVVFEVLIERIEPEHYFLALASLCRRSRR